MNLSNREWMMLRTMLYSMLQNVRDTGDGYYSVSDTLIEEEVELMKKIVK